MEIKEIISILRSNCSRLVQVVDNREMQRIYEATDETIDILQDRLGAGDKRNGPMKPKQIDKDGDIFACPNCDTIFFDEDADQNVYYDFCPNCGQALDWRDD